jgi:hypothetical protein
MLATTGVRFMFFAVFYPRREGILTLDFSGDTLEKLIQIGFGVALVTEALYITRNFSDQGFIYVKKKQQHVFNLLK